MPLWRTNDDGDSIGQNVATNEILDELIERQAGMVARRQLLHHGIDWDHVDHQAEARRWIVRTPRVVSTFTGELTQEQRTWLAVLHAGPRSILGGLTPAEKLGLTGWDGKW